jgi:hypothetical protein
VHARSTRGGPQRRTEFTPMIWTRPNSWDPEVAVWGYLTYESEGQGSRDIEINCVKLVSNNPRSILIGRERIKRMVEKRLGRKLMSMLHFGISPLTFYSGDYCAFKRRGVTLSSSRSCSEILLDLDGYSRRKLINLVRSKWEVRFSVLLAPCR